LEEGRKRGLLGAYKIAEKHEPFKTPLAEDSIIHKMHKSTDNYPFNQNKNCLDFT